MTFADAMAQWQAGDVIKCPRCGIVIGRWTSRGVATGEKGRPRHLTRRGVADLMCPGREKGSERACTGRLTVTAPSGRMKVAG